MRQGTKISPSDHAPQSNQPVTNDPSSLMVSVRSWLGRPAVSVVGNGPHSGKKEPAGFTKSVPASRFSMAEDDDDEDDSIRKQSSKRHTISLDPQSFVVTTTGSLFDSMFTSMFDSQLFRGFISQPDNLEIIDEDDEGSDDDDDDQIGHSICTSVNTISTKSGSPCRGITWQLVATSISFHRA